MSSYSRRSASFYWWAPEVLNTRWQLNLQVSKYLVHLAQSFSFQLSTRRGWRQKSYVCVKSGTSSTFRSCQQEWPWNSREFSSQLKYLYYYKVKLGTCRTYLSKSKQNAMEAVLDSIQASKGTTIYASARHVHITRVLLARGFYCECTLDPCAFSVLVKFPAKTPAIKLWAMFWHLRPKSHLTTSKHSCFHVRNFNSCSFAVSSVVYFVTLTSQGGNIEASSAPPGWLPAFHWRPIVWGNKTNSSRLISKLLLNMSVSIAVVPKASVNLCQGLLLSVSWKFPRVPAMYYYSYLASLDPMESSIEGKNLLVVRCFAVCQNHIPQTSAPSVLTLTD